VSENLTFGVGTDIPDGDEPPVDPDETAGDAVPSDEPAGDTAPETPKED